MSIRLLALIKQVGSCRVKFDLKTRKILYQELAKKLNVLLDSREVVSSPLLVVFKHRMKNHLIGSGEC